MFGRFIGLIRIKLISFLLILVLGSTTAYAQGNLHIGRLTVTPAFRYAFGYNSNVFFAPTNEQDDSLSVLTPSILLGYTGSTPGNYFQAGYTGDWAFYTDLTDNNWQRHSPFVSFGYESPTGFYTKLSDNYNKSEDPFGSFNEFNQSSQFGLGEMTRRWDNLAQALLGYHMSDRYFAEAYYKNYVIKYDQDKDNWQDRMDNTGAVSLFYRMTPKTSVFLEYNFTDADYTKQNDGVFDIGRNTNWSSDTSQDYQLHNLLFGARFEAGAKLSGEAKIGYGNRKQENSVDPEGFPYSDWNGLVINSYVSYQATSRTSFVLNLQHSPLGSPSADAAFFINTLVQLHVRQALAYRLSLNLRGELNNDDYKDEPAEFPSKYFNRFGFFMGLDWAIRPWMTAGIKYEFQEQVASNDFYKSSEFTVHKASINVNFVY